MNERDRHAFNRRAGDPSPGSYTNPATHLPFAFPKTTCLPAGPGLITPGPAGVFLAAFGSDRTSWHDDLEV
jgi:hypothetical protein